MAYSLGNNCTKHYWNQTTRPTVTIIVEGWVIYVFATQYSNENREVGVARLVGGPQ